MVIQKVSPRLPLPNSNNNLILETNIVFSAHNFKLCFQVMIHVIILFKFFSLFSCFFHLFILGGHQERDVSGKCVARASAAPSPFPANEKEKTEKKHENINNNENMNRKWNEKWKQNEKLKNMNEKGDNEEERFFEKNKQEKLKEKWHEKRPQTWK